MVGLVNKLKDTKLLVQTDKRIWSAAGFLFVVITVWLATTSWREPVPEVEKVVRVKPDDDDFMRAALADFQRDLEERKKSRAEIDDVVRRTASELEADRKELEWNTNELIGKLDSVANRVDKLATTLGSRKVEQAELDRKINRQNKQKKPQKVDSGEM